MKKYILKLHTTAIILSLSGIMISATLPAFANSKNKALIAAAVNIAPTVNYVGSDNDGAGFLVKVDAAAPIKFEVSIKDMSGTIFYRKMFESASFSKTFRLINDDNNTMGLIFNIKTLTDGKVHSFKVSSSEKLVTEIVIKKS